MTRADFVALAPLLVLAAAALVLPLLLSIRRRHGLAAGTALVGLLAAAAAIPWALAETPRQVTPLLVVDGYALLYMGLIFLSSAVIVLLCHDYLARRRLERREELYALLLLATLGAAVLVSSTHFASFFLGLETLSISLYAMIAFPRERALAIEAGIKYLILAGATSAVLLFGMALLYAELGTMELGPLAAALMAGEGSVVSTAGLVLILVAVGFKLALAPFHMWAPDVYQGAPAPVTAYLATVSKGGVVALLLRLVVEYEGYRETAVFGALAVLAILSMALGNVLALLQDNVKRILAYSSVAHLGYLLVALLAAGSLAGEAVTFYLVAYFITTIGAFGVVGALPHAAAGGGGESAAADPPEAERLEDYRGLYWSRPAVAAVMTASLLSLAGIPLTAGFIAKFAVLAAGVDAALWLLVWVLIAGSAVGLFYYLRIIVAMIHPPAEGAAPAAAALPMTAGIALALLFVLLVAVGVYPAPVLALIETAVGGLF